jgi:hypothetical protein
LTYKSTTMKNFFYLSSLFFLSLLLVSCGNNASQEVSLVPVKNGKEYQYIDKEGKIIINPQFSEASAFRDGIALVRTSGEKAKWGYIDEDGKYMIAANYIDATVFSEGLAWVVAENGAPTAINPNGEIKITLQDAEKVKIFKEGLAAFSILKDGEYQWGFVDTEGKVVITPQFSATGNFSDGKCAVLNDEGKWGYIDKKGKLDISFQFDGAEKFVNGQAAVEFDGKAGSIDDQGKYVINPQFDDIQQDGNSFLIKQGDKWGWATREGEITINPQFEDVFPFSGGEIAPVKMGDNWGYVDKEGKIKINPQFDGAFPLVSGFALVGSGDKIGLIDGEGKYLANPQFDEVSEDLLRLIVFGSSSYESVDTDFFNIAPIVSRINLTSPEGLTLSNTLGDVVSKLNVSKDIFNKYRETHTVLEDVAITSDATMNFSVQAKSHKEVEDGWYLVSVFNPAAPISGLNYNITLSGRGYDKAEQVLAAIEKTIKGYTKDEAESEDGGWTVYTNGTQKIYLNTEKNKVNVWVMKAK